MGQCVGGRYEVLARLGAGGMGVVYRARQLEVDREVALKVLSAALSDDPEGLARFEREARIVSRLRHPNTVTLHDFGRTEDGALYMVMELLRGRSLNQALREGAPASDAEALEIVDQVCASLEEAHALGVVHRDIKPDNIFLDEVTGRTLHVKVLDFGLARLGPESGKLTRTGAVMGTPEYMSPEQVGGRACDARTDIYQLGVLLFHLLTGRPPFLGEHVLALMMKHAREAPPGLQELRADLGPGLAALVARMLAKEPDARPATVGEVRRALEQARSELETAGPAASRPEMTPAAFSSTAGASDVAMQGESLPPPARPDSEVSGPPAPHRPSGWRWAGALVVGLAVGGAATLWVSQRPSGVASLGDAGVAAAPVPVTTAPTSPPVVAAPSAPVSSPPTAPPSEPPSAPAASAAPPRPTVAVTARPPRPAPGTAPASVPGRPGPDLDSEIERELEEIHR